MEFHEIRNTVEIIFERYRKYKYYTLFLTDYSTSITSTIDEIGGGRSNRTSDKVGDAAIKIADKKAEAAEYVNVVERAVEQLPEIERDLIKHRYMSRDHLYISDYTVYELKMNPPISRPTYMNIRARAFDKLYIMLEGL